MKRPVPVESASAFIDEKIKELRDWRGKTLAKVREIIHKADPEILEEWKWVKPKSPGTPVWSRSGIVCTGETYKNVVKMTFPKGAALKDPSGLFNSSLEGNVRRAIDIHEGNKVDEAALKNLIRAAMESQIQLPDPVWNSLLYSWVGFSVVMGVANILVAQHFSTSAWAMTSFSTSSGVPSDSHNSTAAASRS